MIVRESDTLFDLREDLANLPPHERLVAITKAVEFIVRAGEAGSWCPKCGDACECDHDCEWDLDESTRE